MGSNEMFVLDADGKKQDRQLHEEILDNKTAEIAQSERAIKRAMEKHGMTLEEATSLYGLQPPDF